MDRPTTSGEQRPEKLSDRPAQLWNLELLISGAVVFALFQVPRNLDRLFSELDIHLSFGQGFTLFFAYAYCKLIVFVLIAAFLLHLLARAYWIGLLGLQRVFPEGILWQEMKEGPVMTEEIRRLPMVPELAERTDRLAGTIFSFSFVLVYFFAYSIVLVAGMAVTAVLVSSVLLPGTDIRLIFWVLLTLWLIPTAVPSMIDKSYQKRKKEPSEKAKRRLRPWIRGGLKVMFAAFYAPVFHTFATHLKGRRAYLLVFGAFSLLFAGLFAQLEVMRNNGPTIHGYWYLPPSDGQLSVQDHYYENLRSPDPRLARLPSLSSDVADGPFLKLFLPYYPSRHNEILESVCPEMEPWAFKWRPAEEAPPVEKEGQAIACLSRLYTLELDGQPFEPDFDIYRHPQSGARGLLAYLRTADLELGRHLLKIKTTSIDPDEPGMTHFLPFRR